MLVPNNLLLHHPGRDLEGLCPSACVVWGTQPSGIVLRDLGGHPKQDKTPREFLIAVVVVEMVSDSNNNNNNKDQQQQQQAQ